MLNHLASKVKSCAKNILSVIRSDFFCETWNFGDLLSELGSVMISRNVDLSDQAQTRNMLRHATKQKMGTHEN